jgi:hypothetical protein
MFSVELLENIRLQCEKDYVNVEAGSDCDPGLLREVEEGIVPGLRSHLNGNFVLHASSIQLNETVIALMGDQRTGKSSLSFACSVDAFRMVADGMTVINPANLTVEAGLSRWKLSDESIEIFGRNPTEFEFVNRACRKRYVPFAERESIAPGKVKVVLWVTDGVCERLEPLEPMQQLIALVTNAYLIKIFPIEEQEKVLRRASQLLSSGVIVKRLVRRKRWSTLHDTVKLVQDAILTT